MKRPQVDLAFIGTKGTLLPMSTKARICVHKRQRHRSLRRWRCAVQDGPAGQSKDIPSIEGAVPFDKFDAGLEAALSKGWDKLDNFDEPNMGTGDPQPIAEYSQDEALEETAEASKPISADSDPSMHDEFSDPMEVQSSTDEDMPTPSSSKTKPGTKRKRKSSKAKKGAKESREMTEFELKESVQWPSEPRWYFVQVKPGCEQSTAVSIRNLGTSLESKEIREVLVPTTTIMRLTKGGKSVKKEERFFPSYILVLTIMNRSTYSHILAVPNVQFFMGDPNRDKKKDAPLRPPLPVKDAEMKNVFSRIEEAESAKPEIKTTIRPGHSIKVISGSFVDNLGTVIEVKPDLNVVRARLLIFGRETAVDLQFNQVEVHDKPVDEDVSEDIEVEQSETAFSGRRRSGGGKSMPGAPGPSAGIASHEDDLAALLQETSEEESEKAEDYDGDESDLNTSESEDDGFGEARIFGEDSNDGFSSAQVDSEESDEDSDDALPRKDLLSKTKGLISSDDELAALLSDDYGASAEWESDSDSESSESEELDDLDEFFSSLDELDQAETSNDDSSVPDETDSLEDKMDTSIPRKRKVSEDELMKRMQAPLSDEDDEDDLGFSGSAILAEVDEILAEVEAGKRKIGPQKEDHDLSKSIIETGIEIPEIDLFGTPDIEGHDDPDSTADPPLMKKEITT